MNVWTQNCPDFLRILNPIKIPEEFGKKDGIR
jgi:hypothetical protein